VDFNPSRKPMLRGATPQRSRSDLSTNSSTRQRWRRICEVAKFYETFIVLFFFFVVPIRLFACVVYEQLARDGFLWEAEIRHSGGTHTFWYHDLRRGYALRCLPVRRRVLVVCSEGP